MLLTISLVWLFSLFIVAPPYLFGWGRGEGGGGGGEEEKVVCTIPQVRQSEKVSKECRKRGHQCRESFLRKGCQLHFVSKNIPISKCSTFFPFTFVGCTQQYLNLFALVFPSQRPPPTPSTPPSDPTTCRWPSSSPST